MQKTRNLVIVEDDLVIAREIGLILEQSPYQVLAQIDQAEALLPIVQEKSVDLVLLDIDLAGVLDGVDVAPQLKNNFQIPFIYLTSKTDPSTLSRAALTEPEAYLSKPIREKELLAALQITFFKLDKQGIEKNKDILDEEVNLFVKNKGRLERLNPKEILWMEAKDIYCLVKSTKGQFVLSHSLKSLENQLSEENFIRIHRSYLIALDKIEAIEDNSVIIQDTYLPIGKTYRERLLKRLKII